VKGEKKNDRPSVNMCDGRVLYYNIKDIPEDYGSLSQWRKRGYKPITGVKSAGLVQHWNGQHYMFWKVYSPEQTIPIAGKGAKKRREAWDNEYI
jgi:hypothetical protein